MAKLSSLQSRRWAIVLAGGEGERMRSLTTRWFGRHRPKQYCTFMGSRTMLQHTIDRARLAVKSENILTVIGGDHRNFLDGPLPGTVIEQPEKRDTAPGIFLPATHILAADPSATVLIFPSDHFIYPEQRFLEHVERAALVAERLNDKLVLLGANPDRPETDYGWIEPGGINHSYTWSSRQALRQVRSFHEKPSRIKAENYFYGGLLWNTMIMAVKVRTLWSIGNRLLPDIVKRFESLRRVLTLVNSGIVGEEHAQIALSYVYNRLGSANFSTEVLQRIPDQTVVLPMVDTSWSDWGTPQRILETIEQFKLVPAFPVKEEEEVLVKTG
ncbi:MAG: sugar phosphate nucleotidyltransferase [Acidobacteriota bacterium]